MQIDMEIDDVTNGVVNLMETDNETDLEPSENESDVDFVDDGENISEDASFYRRFNNIYF